MILYGCTDVCPTKDWDFAGDIIPSEVGRKWTVADLKTARFTGESVFITRWLEKIFDQG